MMLIERMLLQATENEVPSPPTPSAPAAAPPRFARPVDYFAVRREARHE
jgi:hypothetical protein